MKVWPRGRNERTNERKKGRAMSKAAKSRNDFRFYTAQGINAKVGIGMKDGRFVVYFPAKGMSKRKGGNVARNPDRNMLHAHMLLSAAASDLWELLHVEYYRAGKAVEGQQPCHAAHAEYGTASFFEVNPKDIKGRGNFAYTLYLARLSPRLWNRGRLPAFKQCDALAQMLGLEPTTNSRPVAVS